MAPRSRRSGAAARDDAAVERFVERFAATLVDSGMPRMPARVFAALLIVDDGALTAAQLAAQLQASPAAISGAVRYLVQVGMVTRTRQPGGRHEVYRLYSDLWYEMLAQRDTQFSRWIDSVRDGVAAVGADTPAGMRLAETGRFFEYLRIELPLLIERWRQHNGASPR
jgi:DNA-binding transcriptional regulator GbsR (MarR family)